MHRKMIRVIWHEYFSFLRQGDPLFPSLGDPLFPSLFIMVMISCLISVGVDCGGIEGFKVGTDDASVSHLQFANDSILFV